MPCASRAWRIDFQSCFVPHNYTASCKVLQVRHLGLAGPQGVSSIGGVAVSGCRPVPRRPRRETPVSVQGVHRPQIKSFLADGFHAQLSLGISPSTCVYILCYLFVAVHGHQTCHISIGGVAVRASVWRNIVKRGTTFRHRRAFWSRCGKRACRSRLAYVFCALKGRS